MRNKMVELEHTLDLEREDFMSLKKEAQQYKERYPVYVPIYSCF